MWGLKRRFLQSPCHRAWTVGQGRGQPWPCGCAPPNRNDCRDGQFLQHLARGWTQRRSSLNSCRQQKDSGNTSSRYITTVTTQSFTALELLKLSTGFSKCPTCPKGNSQVQNRAHLQTLRIRAENRTFWNRHEIQHKVDKRWPIRAYGPHL